MEIRPARVEDAARIAEIHVETWRAAYRGLMSETILDNLSVPKRKEFWEQRIRSNQTAILVAVDDDGVVGWIVYGGSRDADATPAVAEVYGLYVAHAAWRRGAGRLLWEEARRFIDRGDVEAVTLWVLEGNERARRFYEAVGFELDEGQSKLFEREDTVLPRSGTALAFVERRAAFATSSGFVSTPDLHLQTLFELDSRARIRCTREPGGAAGPIFALVRGTSECAWAVRKDIPTEIARDLDAVAREEPPVVDLRARPVHAERYRSILGRRGLREDAGPAFIFPDITELSTGVELIEDERRLDHHFRGWVPGEIAAGRFPVMAVIRDGHPVSICFSARSSDGAAEAGVETTPAVRGRGFAPRVTEAWAAAIRASGRTPLYSTSWTNDASLAVARKLGLIPYAAGWSLYD
jgi:ribosomal protein S18 acetylase RimI-like enzyme